MLINAINKINAGMLFVNISDFYYEMLEILHMRYVVYSKKLEFFSTLSG